MPGGLLLALALTAPSHAWTPGGRFLRGDAEAACTIEPRLILELRLFNGSEEVTSQTRISVHRAGERGEPVAQLPSGTAQLNIALPAGLYDVQAIRERDGRVLNIRWAQRLVVMPYPDEGGRHLEVINFQNGFGALQVGIRDRAQLRVSIHRTGEHDREAGSPVADRDYLLFVLPSGAYDLQVSSPKSTSWHSDIEVPLDRTRLWIVP